MNILFYVLRRAEKIMFSLALACIAWLAGAVVIDSFIQKLPNLDHHILSATMFGFVFIMFAIAFSLEDS